MRHGPGGVLAGPVLDLPDIEPGKQLLVRIVQMLSKMIASVLNGRDAGPRLGEDPDAFMREVVWIYSNPVYLR